MSDKVLDWHHPWANQFVNATGRIVENALDGHIEAWGKSRVTTYWERVGE